MRAVAFVILAGMIAGSIVIYFAAGLQAREAWAGATCRVVGRGCDYPWFVYAGTAVMLMVFILVRELGDARRK